MEYIGAIFAVVFWGYFIVRFFTIFFPNKQKQSLFDQAKLNSWLQNDESKFSELHNYPEDWGMRRQYIAHKYNCICQECGKKGFLGFHVHHILALSKGGTNSLENLTYLCERCHENKHPHMIVARELKYKEREVIRKKAYWKRYWANKRQ